MWPPKALSRNNFNQMNLHDQFKRITTFAFDMDGVLTDGTLFVFDNVQPVRRMHIKDGYAIQLAIKKGFRVVVISGSNSDAVTNRLLGLGVKDVFMNIEDKKNFLLLYVTKNQLTLEEVLYMGDDIPDVDVMKSAGLPCAPADAVPEIKEIATFISYYPGGKGCVREVIEKVLKLNDAWAMEPCITSR